MRALLLAVLLLSPARAFCIAPGGANNEVKKDKVKSRIEQKPCGVVPEPGCAPSQAVNTGESVSEDEPAQITADDVEDKSKGGTTDSQRKDADKSNLDMTLKATITNFNAGVVNGKNKLQDMLGRIPQPSEKDAYTDELNKLKQQAVSESKDGGTVTPETATQTADLLTVTNQPKEAERLYKAALRSQPANVDALVGLSYVQSQQGRAEEAKQTARRALALDPKNKLAGLVAGHSDTLAQGGDGAQNLLKLNFGPQIDPTGHGPKAGAPTAEAARPNPIPLYDIARPRRPSQELVEAALKRQAAGDGKGALLLLSQAADADPEDPAVFVVRAEVGNGLRSYPGAISDATKALELGKGRPALEARALRARAFAKLESGDFSGALADIEAALKAEPNHALGRLYHAMILEKLGRKKEALAEARRALELDAALEPLARPLLDLLEPVPSPAGRFSDRSLRVFGAGAAFLFMAAVLLLTGSGRRLTTTAAKAIAAARSSGHTPVPAGAELRPGDFLGGTYRIVREVGRGGMGVVYEAQDETLQRRVAIKRMQGGDGADLQRFLREARLVAQLKHPHLAEIYNVVVAGEPFLVFEYVEGRGLDARLRDGALPAAQAKKVVAEVCQALEYAHGRNIIHRDLKPSNVLLTTEGAAKVMDFGIAHQSRGVSTMTQTAVCGTPAYMAPEQGFGSVSKASDLYALGVMAYELLTGALPFDQADFMQAKLESRFVSATQRAPSLPRGLDAFFAKALATDPGKRFSSAAEFRAAFERALDGTPAKVA